MTLAVVQPKQGSLPYPYLTPYLILQLDNHTLTLPKRVNDQKRHAERILACMTGRLAESTLIFMQHMTQDVRGLLSKR